MTATELSHILQLLSHLQDKLTESDQKQVEESSFREYFKIRQTPTGTQYPDYFESKQFCLNADLIEVQKDFLHLTKLGETFLNSSSSKEAINKIIIKECLSNSYFTSILIPLLKQFQNDEQNEYWIEKNKVRQLFKQTKILEILYNVEFLKFSQQPEKVLLNPVYTKNKLVLRSLKKGQRRKISQSELEDNLLKQKRIGEIAEKFVLEFEKERLAKDGCVEKANNVERISQKWANAGYDIESFDGQESDDILPDRFIEVKGTSGKEFSIFWSTNEIQTAKDKGPRYWIYFVSEVDVVNGVPEGKKPVMIPNPYDKIKPYEENSIDAEYFKTLDKIHVEKNQ